RTPDAAGPPARPRATLVRAAARPPRPFRPGSRSRPPARLPARLPIRTPDQLLIVAPDGS
ncbi:hypothetical protein ACN6LD_001689, partial [Streptomyces sp. SAS_272]